MNLSVSEERGLSGLIFVGRKGTLSISFFAYLYACYCLRTKIYHIPCSYSPMVRVTQTPFRHASQGASGLAVLDGGATFGSVPTVRRFGCLIMYVKTDGAGVRRAPTTLWHQARWRLATPLNEDPTCRA